ncbi:hypothetical protein K2173_018581 [Erythroxylum novogranatense]|uniref:Uncharacterized protein n=1 Tax=Erythroxylum novogranatense TaxID=1862640 RepID=A0AAV8UE94_9ROSI|nr:hypothetical protein K2173_018581 [Erythroxylum novogranatense]
MSHFIHLKVVSHSQAKQKQERMILEGVEEEEKGLVEGIVGIQHNAFYIHRALVGFSISRLARLAEQAERYDGITISHSIIVKF